MSTNINILIMVLSNRSGSDYWLAQVRLAVSDCSDGCIVIVL